MNIATHHPPSAPGAVCGNQILRAQWLFAERIAVTLFHIAESAGGRTEKRKCNLSATFCSPLLVFLTLP